MVMFDYFESVLEGVEFLIAVGSIVGLLGIFVGLIFLIWGSSRMRYKMVGVVLVSFLLLGVCGPDTGMKYFRVFR